MYFIKIELEHRNLNMTVLVALGKWKKNNCL